MSFQEKYNEYKEKQEAKRYFRSQNDQFLNKNQWIKMILHGLVAAIIMGVLHGALTASLSIDFSIFYLIIGYAMANVVVHATGVQSPSTGYASVVMTFMTFFISRFIILIMPTLMLGMPLSYGIRIIGITLRSLFTGNILDLLFMLVGLFFSYQQAQ